jgi:uroporphyrinogen decarboxylase
MLASAGIHVLVAEDDIATTNSLLISPKHFMEFVNPYNKRLVVRAHELGLKVVRHSDGNLWSIMDILIASGYDGINPLEPQAGMDLQKVKEAYGDKICLLGNIDCKELLSTGTPRQVETAVKHAIDVAAKGGGYILCDSNSLHPGVNPENCIAMFEATKKYGYYQ